MSDSKPTNELPRMVPDRDDIRVRTTPRQSEQKAKPSTKPAATETKQSNHSWLNTVWVIIGGVAIAYLALQQYSLNQTIISYEERLALSDDRIVYLEQSLTQTDESVAMNETAINAQFKAIKSEADLHMAEIRKLWDVTNKRNKAWIEENQASVKTLTESIAAINTQADTIETVMADLQADGDKNASIIGQLSGRADQQQQLIEQAQATLSSLQNELANVSVEDLEEQIVSIRFAQENLQAEQGIFTDNDTAFAKKLADVQGSVDSVSASRIETNKRLSALTAQIEALDARLTSVAGPTTAQ